MAWFWEPEYWQNIGDAFSGWWGYTKDFFTGKASFDDWADNATGLDMLGAIFGQNPNEFGFSKGNVNSSEVGDLESDDINEIVDNINDINSSWLEDQRKWEEEQAQKQMDFQERMSSTAYQRAVQDMESAGLNPMLLAHQNGASTPTGAMAHTSSQEFPTELLTGLMANTTSANNNLIKIIGSILGAMVLKGKI